MKWSSLHSPNLPDSPNSPNLCNTCQTCLSRVWRVRATQLGECRQVWRVRATRLGECRRVWQVTTSTLTTFTKFALAKFPRELPLLIKNTFFFHTLYQNIVSFYFLSVYRSGESFTKMYFFSW